MPRFRRLCQRARMLLVIAIWLVTTLGLVTTAVAASRPQQAPDSRVVLDLPDGYEPSALFSGFTNEQTGSSIVIVEMPDKAFADLEIGMTSDALALKGIVNSRRLRLDRPDPHIYMQAEQTSPAGAFAKFFVVIRQSGVTALITANVPQSAINAGNIGAIEIETALTSARIVETATPARDLFRIGDLGPFKPTSQRLGTARVYTLDGHADPADSLAGKPLLIVAPSIDRRPVASPEVHSEQLLAGLPGVVDIKLQERRQVSIGGLLGIEMIASARDREGSLEVTLYHVLLVAPQGGYFRIVGQVQSAERERFLPILRRIAETFEVAK